MKSNSLFKRCLKALSVGACATAAWFAWQASAQAGCVTPPPGLVSWWRGEGNATDTVGGNNGVFTGASFGPGEVGQAFKFDGSGNNVRVPLSSSLNVGSEGGLTIEGWIYSTDNTNGRPIAEWVSKTVGGYAVHFFVHQGFPGTLDADLYDTLNNHHEMQSPAGLVLTNVFQHVAVTYDKTSGTGRLYINGAIVKEAFLGTFTPETSPDLSIGYRPSTVPFGPIPFIGSIDELSIYSRALSSNEVQAIYNAGSAGKCVVPPSTCVTPPSGLVSWWRAESNALDSVSGNNGTYSTPEYATGEVGEAFNFDGSGNNVRVPASPSMDIGSGGGMTIESWIYSTDGSSTHPIVEWVPKAVGAYGTHFYVHQNGPGVLYADLYDTANNHHMIETPPGLVQTNMFQHVAVTYDKASGIARLYVNGTLATQSVLGTFTPLTSPDLLIGYRPNTVPFGPIPFLGRIDEVSLYSRALSSNEVQAIYMAGSAGKCVEPPSTCVVPPSGLVSWWRAESNALDSVSGNNGTFSNPEYANGEVGEAFNFDGSGNNIRVPASSSMDIGSDGGMTIESWIYSTDNTNGRPIAEWVSKTVGGYAVHFFVHQGFPGTLDADLYDTLNNHHELQSPAGLVRTNVFQHVAVTYDKASGIGRLYINGTIVKEAVLGSFTPQTSPDLSIGYRPSTIPFGPIPFIGNIDELSIYSRALSSNEVQAIYNAGSAGKCVVAPSTCVPPASGLVSWWRAESNALDSVSGNNGTFSTPEYATGEVGEAFNFDGSGNNVRVPASSSLDIGSSGGMTIESWIYSTDTSSPRPIVEWVPKAVGAFGTHFYVHQHGPGVLYADLYDTANNHHMIETPPGLVQTNVFQHVTVTYDKASGIARLYVNGTLATQSVLGTFTPQTSPDLSIGYRPNTVPFGPIPFFGRIDEVSLYSRALSSNEIQTIYNAGSAGKCTSQVPPSFVAQPASETVTVGGTASFTIVAAGSSPLGYQWQKNGTNLTGATTTSFTIQTVRLSDDGGYSVVVSNAVGVVTSTVATLTVTPPPVTLLVSSSSVAPDGTVTVPINLLAGGNESAVSFSLNFDPTLLQYASVVLGSNAAAGSLLLNTSLASTGQIGVALALPAGTAFSAGTQQVVVATFNSPILTSAKSTGIGFGDAPIKRQVADASGAPLSATYVSGTVLLPISQLEGDVYPRPNGDEALTISDWVLVGRYVAGLDSPTNSSEFQRADCAPRATLGDGQLTVSDWVQAGRYAAGLDPATRAGGPNAPVPMVVTTPTAGPEGRQIKSSLRQVRASASAFAPGEIGTIDVALEAQGVENALAFSLAFDPAKLVFSGVAIGAGASGVTLNVNTNQTASGRLGFVLALAANRSFAPGSVQLVHLSFRPTSSAANGTLVSFSDQPVRRGVCDPTASALDAEYVNATIEVAPLPSLNIVASSSAITLSWPASASGFVLQESAASSLNAANWKAVSVTPSILNNSFSVTMPANENGRFYRLFHP